MSSTIAMPMFRFSTLPRLVLLLAYTMLGSITLHAATYYWVGGIGDWSDLTHWATTSGGSVTHTSLPGPADDVVFDQNSFYTPAHTVFLDVQQATCRNMTWQDVTNYPILSFDNNLEVYGSLTFNPNMTVTHGHAGTIPFLDFMSDSVGNTIDFAGIRFGDGQSGASIILRIKGSGTFDLLDSLVLGDDLFTASKFIHRDGVFRTNGHKIACSWIVLEANDTTGGEFYFSSSEIHCKDCDFLESHPKMYSDSARITGQRITATTPFRCESIELDNYATTQFTSALSAGVQDSFWVKRLLISGNGAATLGRFVVEDAFEVNNAVPSLQFSYLDLLGTVSLLNSSGSSLALGGGATANVLHRDNDTLCLAYIDASRIQATGSAFWKLNSTCSDLGNNLGNLAFVDCDAVLGNASFNPMANDLLWYPSRVKAGEILHLSGQAVKGKVEVLDVQGRSIASQGLATDNSLQIPEGCQGIYLLRTVTPKGHFSQKILVE